MKIGPALGLAAAASVLGGSGDFVPFRGSFGVLFRAPLKRSIRVCYMRGLGGSGDLVSR